MEIAGCGFFWDGSVSGLKLDAVISTMRNLYPEEKIGSINNRYKPKGQRKFIEQGNRE